MKVFTLGKEWNICEGNSYYFIDDDGYKTYMPAVYCYEDDGNRGFRDDDLFGDGERNPVEVCCYEMYCLGNDDIPFYLISHYGEQFDDEEKEYLKGIANGDVVEVDKWYLDDILKKVIGERDFCIWLCSKPEDVFQIYGDGFFDSWEEYLECSNLISYRIPDDAVILSDLGIDGKLYAWKQ